MGFQRNEKLKKSKCPAGSIVLYVASVIVILIGIAYLVTNIVLFQKTVAQYVAQGYPAATVANQLLPSQLLPGIYEPVAVYGGIALILFAAGLINQKVSSCLKRLEKLGAEGAGTDVGPVDMMAPAAGGSESDGPKSDELGPSEFEEGEVETGEVETSEAETGDRDPVNPA